MKTKTTIAVDGDHFTVMDEEGDIAIQFTFMPAKSDIYPDFALEAIDAQAALRRRDHDSAEVKAIAGWQDERNRVAALVEESKARVLAKAAEIINAARRNLA